MSLTNQNQFHIFRIGSRIFGNHVALLEMMRVTNFIDANPSAAVVEVTEHLLKRFHVIKASRSTVYNFMRSEWNLSLKKADFHSIERNSPAKIEERHDWVCKWENTDMNFLTNCVFLDESAFDINMKRLRAWSSYFEKLDQVAEHFDVHLIKRDQTVTKLSSMQVAIRENVPAKKHFQADALESEATTSSRMSSEFRMNLCCPTEHDRYIVEGFDVSEGFYQPQLTCLMRLLL